MSKMMPKFSNYKVRCVLQTNYCCYLDFHLTVSLQQVIPTRCHFPCIIESSHTGHGENASKLNINFGSFELRSTFLPFPAIRHFRAPPYRHRHAQRTRWKLGGDAIAIREPTGNVCNEVQSRSQQQNWKWRKLSSSDHLFESRSCYDVKACNTAVKFGSGVWVL